MSVEEFCSAVGVNWSIRSVPRLIAQFGGSFEATTFRLASAHPHIAAAGLLKYRRRKEEQKAAERIQAAKAQALLFSGSGLGTRAAAKPKYRRQSFHISDGFPAWLTVRWNKSFDTDSVVYQAADGDIVLRGDEPLPNGAETLGWLEVVAAPYQRDDADPNHPDLLFLWVAI